MTLIAEASVPDSLTAAVDVEIVVPVYNEEDDLAPSIRRLSGFLTNRFPFSALITIADNASTDRTWDVALSLADEFPGVRAVHLEAKGRGRALRTVWRQSSAKVVSYMDVDLSTDLNALLPLVAPLLSGHSDIAIGSRLSPSSRVVRGPKREVISRCYNLLLRTTLHARFSDAQCGFKALRTEAARALLPYVQDPEWFFDTELLVLAQRTGMRIAEVPVDWVDDPDSRVEIVSTAMGDLRGIVRLTRSLATGRIPIGDLRRQLGRNSRGTNLFGQALRFAAVGVFSTIAYLTLFVALRSAMGSQAANFLALLLTAVLNTAANRRYTFGVHGSGVARQQAQGLLVFALGLALTSASLAALHTLTPSPPGAAETAVLVVANLLATVLRFVLFREWVFGRTPHVEETE